MRRFTTRSRSGGGVKARLGWKASAINCTPCIAYCAFEALFEVVAGTFENQIAEEGRYRIELLRRLTVAIEGVRPALLSPECYRLLDNLRAFRHFFRHAYSIELDERKVRLALGDALKLKDLHQRNLDRFMQALEE